jgi:hypothetical protein
LNRAARKTQLLLFKKRETVETTMKVLTFIAAALSAINLVDAFAAIAPGAKIPSVELHKGFPPEMVNIADYVKGRKVAVVGLPAAFTPVRF